MGRVSKVKYLEEMDAGDTIEFENNYYVVTADYKKSGSRSCVNLKTGLSKWIEPNAIVDINPIYLLDSDNNIVAIKPTEK